MKDYFNLASDIAQTYRIVRGTNEQESIWLARVIYSFLGQSALASLWDLHEDELPTSIERFKERITIIKNSCIDLYPEIAPFFSDDNWRKSESVSNEIYDIFLSTGYCYKSPRRLSPVIRSSASAGQNIFLRGYATGENIWVSGLGAYCSEAREQGSISLPNMFQLSNTSLEQAWKQIVASKRWEPAEASQFVYLRLEAPFTQGYWYDKMKSDGDVSLARTAQVEGTRIYYLYRAENGQLLVSQLPEWMVDAGAYRNLSNACLYHYGSLPPTIYQSDGTIVHLQIQYLYPPAEQNLIRLYSWPDFENHHYVFGRVMDANVFHDIKIAFQKNGYRFEEA